jgi:hypothetical protein
MALDPLAVATTGYLSKYNRTTSIATDGYLSVYAFIVIPVKVRGGGPEKRPTKKDWRLERERIENQQYQEDSEIMLIIQMFMMKWN